MKKLAFVIFLLIPLSGFCYSSSRRQRARGEAKNQGHGKNFDSLKLSVNWSPIVCQNFAITASDAACSLCKSPKAINKWTIHGLWPSREQQFGPFECSNKRFDPTLLSAELKLQLKAKWPSLKSSSDESFWTHEWKRHGTCASNVNGVSDYFSKTIQLYDQYNVGKALGDSEVLPNGNYQLKVIQDALKKSFGVNVFVACFKKKGIREQILSEIRLCFDKSFQLIDCGHDSRHLSNCYRRTVITYLESC